MRLLVIEDEPSLNNSIVTYLQEVGFLCDSALDYKHGKLRIADYSYDCVLVDLTLPGGNGLELVRLLKENSPETGIIIISAKDALDDKVKGLEIGADDYLTKPFHLSELNARVNSVIRRRSYNGHKTLKAGGIEIFPDSAEVLVDDKLLALTKKEYDLLLYFVTNQNRILTKDAIAEHLWGDIVEAMDSLDFIYTHIKNLRQKIISESGTNYIKTIYGMGYKFSVE